ncbi:hypothetical protein SAMN05661008_00816 [Alkalithermobacter thermoalcaliphilus JW-YL-7 = DSM 7308]|uniref:Uncharacterized protein n=1 Tax=Alkalithermobacter thermoalcaliphilus JW-YL-7 = DSM 7308 TaxID=1121328 RepID=A0A150FQS4_CLOPD|nr:hypothetical protein JWYL7_1036 [[Clostridium] paradoxum JW-YL-7 = DSM 7308]SHK75513.1 hypothetical protein SAMN05661008_00816 [[Clostridium] paradoxum JW-YL-7 = DSM 7308]
MEIIDETIQYILFSSISKILNDFLDNPCEDIDYLENLINYYTENYGKNSQCLVAKLEMIKSKAN